MTVESVRSIVIADYDPSWPEIFRAERDAWYAACGRDAFVRIEHVGSTSVPGLAAKPIIDMMPGVRSLHAFQPLIPRIEAMGYRYVWQYEYEIPGLGPGMPERRFFTKDIDGKRAFNVHVVEATSDFWRNHQVFRNWLRYSPDDRKAYEDLKRRLAERYNAEFREQGIDINVGYTDHKSELIASILEKARAHMAKQLPYRVTSYDEAWPVIYERERAIVAAAVGDVAVDIQHVGSTSVPGIEAKPIIDIALGVRSIAEGRTAIDALAAAGFRKGNTDRIFNDWINFSKLAEGVDAVHLHMVPHGSARWRQYMTFRNYLRAHPEDAAAYGRLKRELIAEFGPANDRLGYGEAKTELVEEILSRARSAG